MVPRGFLLPGFLLAFVIALSAQQAPGPQTPSPAAAAIQSADPVSVLQDVQYGVAGGEKLLLDIYQPISPSSKPRPAVVLIHGGSWSSLDKVTMHAWPTFWRARDSLLSP
jgi:acetyl esterase/lipase